MIESLSIKRFRGVTEGHIEGLFPLTVFMGPNNSGKSTCLEALATAFSSPVTGALMLAVRRRGWLGLVSAKLVVPDSGTELKIVFSRAKNSSLDRISRQVSMQWVPVVHQNKLQMAKEAGLESPMLQLHVLEGERVESAGAELGRRTDVFVDHQSRAQGFQQGIGVGPEEVGCVLLDASALPQSIEEALLRVDSMGEAAHRSLVESLRAVDPALLEVRPIPVDGRWIPHATYEKTSVPIAVSGDGVKRLFRIAGELAVLRRGGVALLEEPECFQHTRSLRELVRVIWNSIDQGNQIVMSTHSMELFDILCAEAKAKDGHFQKFGVFRFALSDGILKTTRVPGPDAFVLREELAEDLRR